ncbi:MAG: hypothetical protein HZA17_10875 [Nitrospirae bacterium]|nr:hypothetical protein [Nitrospirota bacterium]
MSVIFPVLQNKNHGYAPPFLLFLIVLFFTLLSSEGSAAPKETQPGLDAATDQAAIEEKWGVRILGIRLSADGYMLDFRYRVTDPEKALPLFDRKVRPYTIEQSTGMKLLVPAPPKIGSLRTTRKPVAETNYFIMFGNPGGRAKKGGKVSVVVGDFRVENLIVE